MNYEELQSKVLDTIEKKDESVSFAQDVTFEQSFGIDKTLIEQGIGGALSGTFSGIVSGLLPINVGIAGFPVIVGGIVMKKFIGKTGMLKNISDGLIVAGISEAVSSLIGGGILGSLGQERKELPEKEITNTQTGVIY
jgi:hypothetical protein